MQKHSNNQTFKIIQTIDITLNSSNTITLSNDYNICDTNNFVSNTMTQESHPMQFHQTYKPSF